MRRRLYLQIYAAFLGAVALSVCAAAATAWLVWEPNQVSAPVRGAVVVRVASRRRRGVPAGL